MRFLTWQAIRYFQLPASTWERLTVTTGLIAAAIGAALVGYDYHQQTVVYYVGFENMPWYSWMSGLNCLMGGVVVLCTQTIFAFRLIRVSTFRIPCKLAEGAELFRLICCLATNKKASSR
jgi:hypothetical protein